MELKNVLSQKKYNELLNSSDYFTYNLTYFNFIDEEIEHKTEKALYSTILPKYYSKENNEFYYLKKVLIKDFMQHFYNHIQIILHVNATEKKAQYFLLSKKDKKLKKKKIIDNLIKSEYIKYYSDNKFNETIFKSDYIKELIERQISIKELITKENHGISCATSNFPNSKLVTELINFEIERVLYCLLDDNYIDDLENQNSIFKNIKYKKNEHSQLNKPIQTATQLQYKGIGLKWHIVGVWFATGLIEILHKQQGNSFTAIAKLLGDANYRPYISESYGNTNRNDKNIFSDKSKTKTIIEFCEHNKIELSECFTTRMNANR